MMRVTTAVKKMASSGLRELKKYYLLTKIPDLYWAGKLIQVNPETVEYNKAKSSILLKDFNITIEKEKNIFFLELLHYAYQLKDLCGARFEVVGGDLYATIDDVKFHLETEDEIYLLAELFLEGCYNFIPSKPAVVLDIGMNVGFSSLYFAMQPCVQAVIGFEPFPQTFAQAERNFSLNPDYATIIEPRNVALSNKEEEVAVDYNYACRCIAGIGGMPDDLKSAYGSSKENIQVISASNAVETVRNQYPGIEIIAKMDCEGSEYQIIESLCASKMIDHIKAFLIEWHDHSQNTQLMDRLGNAGFSQIFLNPQKKDFGMLYAIRTAE